MKAVKAGQVVAKALQAYENSDPAGVGKILALVNVSWYDPDAYLTSTGDLQLSKSEILNPKSETNSNVQNSKYQITNVAGEIITRVGAFAEVAAAKVRAGLIEAKKLVVDEVDILKKLQELSDKADKQQQTIESQQKEIEELKVTVEELKNR